jgi:ornithine carbamoyltransferase
MNPRHFLTLTDLSPQELQSLINRAIELKAMQKRRELFQPFVGYVMGMVFEKSSTRTRVSFEAGMAQLGGHALFLSSRDTQLGRGEPVEDSARVLSSMVDILMVRTFGHEQIERFARFSSVPVINALTDSYHPCQLLADIQTYVEHRGAIKGKTVAWIGDGNNMCQSYIKAARQFDFELKIACPEGYEPDAQLLKDNADRVSVLRKPAAAARDANLLVTDVWASMGQEAESKQRLEELAGYQLNEDLLAVAATDALYMHCLPAHRGEEISAGLMDSDTSVIWNEAENRLHAQKALIEFLLNHSK